MSRIGKIPVVLSKAVKASLDKGSVKLEGAKGQLTCPLPKGIAVEVKDGHLIVTRASDSKQDKANHGTVRALLKNMAAGVEKGHKKELEIQGVGFRAQLQGSKLTLNLGFSHPVEFQVPKEVKVALPNPTSILIEGVDKAVVGQVAAKIRDFKRPEPYKGKGIRYSGETVRRKQGKSVTK